MPTKPRKKMGPEERRSTSRRLLALAGRVVPLAIAVAIDLADGQLSPGGPIVELAQVVAELVEVLAVIRRDRADGDDVPEAKEV